MKILLKNKMNIKIEFPRIRKRKGKGSIKAK
jgi:hypothetical protein